MSEQTKEPNNQPTPPPVSEDLDQATLDQIDSLIEEADPTFKEQVAKLKSEKFEGDLEVEKFEGLGEVEPEVAKASTKSPSKFAAFLSNRKRNLSVAVKSFIPYLIGLLAGFVGSANGGVKSLLRLSRKGKFIVLAVIVLIVSLFFIVQKSMEGRLLPDFELKFLTSFAKVADRSFKVEDGESFEDFDNPLRHPEYIVLIERLVVNLKDTDAGGNPMGMFEFYVEASSQEGAIEINERQKEIRDLMARTLETATYPELASADGKEKMKMTLRRELNTLLTQGRVRRVFFKTILLNP